MEPPEALQTLYARHADAMTAYAQAILGSRSLAEDAAQETFTEMLENPQRFAQALDPRAFLFGAVRLSALQIRRRRKRWWAFAPSLPEKAWLVPAPGASEPSEHLEALAKAVAGLPEAEREAVLLKTYGGLTFVQMGEVSGVSPKTMESRYYAALERLKADLEKTR